MSQKCHYDNGNVKPQCPDINMNSRMSEGHKQRTNYLQIDTSRLLHKLQIENICEYHGMPEFVTFLNVI